jgi:hypothetical protein
MWNLNTLIAHLTKNKLLFWLGTMHLVTFFILLASCPYNDKIVLGVNSLFKPMKFALSIWIFSWTMALILNHVLDLKKVKIYSIVAVICMCFEQAAITFQAVNGELSHFNKSSLFGIILYSLMGIFILTLTLWTAYIAYVFSSQKNHMLSPVVLLGIKFGLSYFVLFSLFGGYISGLPGHTIGATDGSQGLWFLNWSRLFGDLRVAHFFGIHSLQIIPLFAIIISNNLDMDKSVKVLEFFALAYYTFIIFTMVQGLLGIPFL